MSLSITTPTDHGSSGTWGSILNAALAAIVSFVNTTDTTANAALPKAGGAMTGRADLFASTLRRYDLGPVSGAQSLNLANAHYFTAQNNGGAVFSFTGATSVANSARGVVLRLTNGGASVAATFPGVNWPGGSMPTLTAAGVDILVFLADDDAGSVWRGTLAMKDVR